MLIIRCLTKLCIIKDRSTYQLLHHISLPINWPETLRCILEKKLVRLGRSHSTYLRDYINRIQFQMAFLICSRGLCSTLWTCIICSQA